MTTTTWITSDQIKQIIQFGSNAVKQALEECGLNQSYAQRVIKHDDEFTAAIHNATVIALENLAALDLYPFNDRENVWGVERGYLSGYRTPLPVPDQIDILRLHWPTLKPDRALRYMREVYPKLQLPSWVEGPFALICPKFFSDSYRVEIEEVLKALEKARSSNIVNSIYGNRWIYLEQDERIFERMRRITKQQPDSDIIIAPGQFGIRHRGRSVDCVRGNLQGNEFGEGAKNVGTMLLTHGNRLQHDDDLQILCPEDYYADDLDADFACAPHFGFYEGRLKFDSTFPGHQYACEGSVSAFIPSLC